MVTHFVAFVEKGAYHVVLNIELRKLLLKRHAFPLVTCVVARDKLGNSVLKHISNSAVLNPTLALAIQEVSWVLEEWGLA